MKFIIQQVQGDGEYIEVAVKPTERSAANYALQLMAEHRHCYGQALRHIVTGRTIGTCKVVCPDGTTLSGDDLSISAQ